MKLQMKAFEEEKGKEIEECKREFVALREKDKVTFIKLNRQNEWLICFYNIC